MASIDRASHLRTDTDRLMAALDAPETRLVPVWRNKNRVVTGSRPGAVVPSVRDAGALIDAADELVWLGLLDGVDCFAVDLSSRERPLGTVELPGNFADLRLTGGLLTAAEANLLAYARGMLHWNRHHRYCGTCGKPTRPRDGGHVRECTGDGERHFPRTNPAVMILVARGEHCVLARQSGWPAGMYSVLAGFVEPGETIEEAAVREAKEETGLAIENVRYFRSQPWPFPASLMLGMLAETRDDTLKLEDDELEEARWFSRSELARPEGFFYPPEFSLAHHLIQAFLGGR